MQGRVLQSSKEIAYAGVTAALLIAVQLCLSAVQGVELVTAVFLAYCTAAGAKRGVAVATVFSLLRCLLFGFFLNVVALYLVYYNAFALLFALLGRATNKFPLALRIALFTGAAMIVTACFTLLDDLLTPFILGYAPKSRKAYFLASLPAMGIQSACAGVSVAFLWYPLHTAFLRALPKHKKV